MGKASLFVFAMLGASCVMSGCLHPMTPQTHGDAAAASHVKAIIQVSGLS